MRTSLWRIRCSPQACSNKARIHPEVTHTLGVASRQCAIRAAGWDAGKFLEDFWAAVSDRGRVVRSTGERPPTRGVPSAAGDELTMQYLVSVINDNANLATPEEDAADRKSTRLNSSHV